MIRLCRGYPWSGWPETRCNKRFTLTQLVADAEQKHRPHGLWFGIWCPSCDEEVWQDYLSSPAS